MLNNIFLSLMVCLLLILSINISAQETLETPALTKAQKRLEAIRKKRGTRFKRSQQNNNNSLEKSAMFLSKNNDHQNQIVSTLQKNLKLKLIVEEKQKLISVIELILVKTKFKIYSKLNDEKQRGISFFGNINCIDYNETYLTYSIFCTGKSPSSENSKSSTTDFSISSDALLKHNQELTILKTMDKTIKLSIHKLR